MRGLERASVFGRSINSGVASFRPCQFNVSTRCKCFTIWINAVPIVVHPSCAVVCPPGGGRRERWCLLLTCWLLLPIIHFWRAAGVHHLFAVQTSLQTGTRKGEEGRSGLHNHACYGRVCAWWCTNSCRADLQTPLEATSKAAQYFCPSIAPSRISICILYWIGFCGMQRKHVWMKCYVHIFGSRSFPVLFC